MGSISLKNSIFFFKVFVILLVSITFSYNDGIFSEKPSEKIVLSYLNWLVIQNGGTIEILDDKIYNLTHLKGNLGDVAIISLESFVISSNPIEINISFKIFDVVDPTGTKSYAEAETRQRILLIDAYNYTSILPFDFGFFEALTGDPLGGNRLWIFWREKTNIQISYNKIFRLRILINSSLFFVQIYDEKDYIVWSQYYLSNFSDRRIRIGIFAGESVGRGGHLLINNYNISTSLSNLLIDRDILNHSYPIFLFNQLKNIHSKIKLQNLLKNYIIVFNSSLFNYITNFSISYLGKISCIILYKKAINGDYHKVFVNRLSYRLGCFPVEIYHSETNYIKNLLATTYLQLRSKGLIDLIPEIIIVGNYSEIPPYEIKVSEDTIIYSDYPYADLNDDGYQDFPIRRLCCTPEEINLQVEATRIANLTKNVLIAHTYYNLNESDEIQGLFNPFRSEILKIKYILEKNNYNVERIGEKRLTSKEIENLVGLFASIIEKIIKGEISFSEALKTILTFFKLANSFLNLNYEYEIYKFKRIETLNSTNLLKRFNESSIAFLFLRTEKDKYILPSNKTHLEKINASDLPFIQIVFDMSENSFSNTFDKIISFAKITYRNQTTYTNFNEGISLLASALQYSEPLSLSIMYARNSLKVIRDSIIPNIIQKISEDYRKKVIDELNTLIFYGENYQLIYKNKTYYSVFKLQNINSQNVIRIKYKDVCNVINITINQTNISTFNCNYTNFEILDFSGEPKVLYYIIEKIQLPQYKSLKDFKVNYSYFSIDEDFNLAEINKFYDIILVNNTYDVQDIYLVIYPAIFYNGKTYLLKDFSIEIYYNDSLEIKDIYSKNGKIYIKIYSDIERNFSIEILKNNQSIINDSKIVFGEKEFSYDVEEGKYLVRVSYFEISYEKELNVTKQKIYKQPLEIPFYKRIEIFADSLIKIFRNYFLKEYEFRNSSHYIYTKQTPFYELNIKNSKITLKTSDFEYERISEANYEKESIKTPYGYLEIKFENGSFYEEYRGNYNKLKKDLEKAREMLKTILNETLSS